uniref:Uncharacterized protein n=1 Tax=Picea sitchensis TaxID=3332 RepID=A9NYJ1_PICSI|nr:unknown [Picea sitchensis]
MQILPVKHQRYSYSNWLELFKASVNPVDLTPLASLRSRINLTD